MSIYDLTGTAVLDAVKADAKQRTVRTFVQGAIATILVAVLPLVSTAISAGVDKVNWIVLEQSALTAGTMALCSYLMGVLRPVTGPVPEPAPVVVPEPEPEPEPAAMGAAGVVEG